MSERNPAAKPFVDLSDEQVFWDLSNSLSYGQYLNLDKLLAAQHPLSYQHDEMLFIVIHQVSELWMKLCLHELTATVDCVRRDDLGPTFKMLTRVSTIQQQLLQAWDVLATVTPYDYSAFRNSLGRSSGFQSAQYRMLEFLIGNKNADTIEVFRADPPTYELLERALRSPSLYDEVLRLLSRRGLDVPPEAIDRDFRQPYQASKQVGGGVAQRLPQFGQGLGFVRAGGAPGRPRLQVPIVAIRPCEDGRAHHRLQARHRRHQRGVLPDEGAGAEIFSGTVDHPNVHVGRM